MSGMLLSPVSTKEVKNCFVTELNKAMSIPKYQLPWENASEPF
jgi:hypothetical protein